MKTHRDLSGRELAKLLCRHWEYREVAQSGSHIILQTETPTHQRLPIPAHRALKVGTLNAILRLVADHKGVPATGFWHRLDNRLLRFLFAAIRATLLK